jgi:ATP-dependent RNA helicase RhlB
MALFKGFTLFKRNGKTIENQTQTPPDGGDKPKFLTQTHFDSFDLPAALLEGLHQAGFVQCSPIQAQTLPISLAGQDVAGQAQTGTGKTAAFLVTVLSRLMEMPDRQPGVPAAVIVAPTRELAQQIFDEASLIGKNSGLTMVQIVGGVDYVKQADRLRKGVDIVICTPGRIIDYMKQGIFKTGGVKIVVIDEADRLLDLGFEKDMRFLLRKMPKYDQRQSMLFSATLSHRVMELTYEYMNLPEFISVTPEEIAVKNIEQELFHVGKDEKLSLLLGLLKKEEWHRMLIFVNTKMGVEWLTQKLKGNGWPAEGITGDLPQKKRFRLMDQYKNGQLKILIATDVASRGIHVEDISHVINYDLPQDPENYVHRIGRTARAGKTGRALSLACERYVFHLKPLEELLEYQIPIVWPEDSWFQEDVAGPVPDERRTRRSPRGAGAKNARGRTRKSAPRRRQEPALPSRPKDYFPGTFFGFKPKAKGAAKTAPQAEKPDENGAEEKTASAPAKRRRPYRRKRRPAARKKSAGNKTAPKKAPSGKDRPRKAAPQKTATRKRASRKTAAKADS